MKNVHDNYWIPDDGYRFITNGIVFSRSIYIGKTDNIDNWRDTNDDPPAPPEPGEEATAEDYEAALNRLGVET